MFLTAKDKNLVSRVFLNMRDVLSCIPTSDTVPGPGHQSVLLLTQGACGEGVASTLHRTSEAMISLRERVLAEGRE